MSKYRLKAEKWDEQTRRWIPCRVILTAVYVKNIKHGKKGEIMCIEEV